MNHDGTKSDFLAMKHSSADTTTKPPPVAGIRCRALAKSFGSHRVLDGLNMTVWPGRVYALLGRNGAGKSTLFTILLGIERADSGSMEILGRPWGVAALREIGASVDGPALYPSLTAAENLLVHTRLLGLSTDLVDPLLEQVGLGATGSKRAGRFSMGMQARLALALALLADPLVLLLDEPQNGLDPEGIIELREILRGLAANGRTILVSSHQLGEVRHLADDIGVLTDGRLLYEGPLEQFSDGDLEAAYLEATRPSALGRAS